MLDVWIGEHTQIIGALASGFDNRTKDTIASRSMPRLWLYTQIAILIFVVWAIVIAIVRLA
jgi:hypothetical protein